MSIQKPYPHRRYEHKNLKHLLGLGLTGVFGYGVFFLVGMAFTTAAQGSIIAGFNPVTVSLFAHIIHKERLKQSWQYSGFVISFVGIFFVIGVQSLLEFSLEYLLGNLIILCAMVMWGLYSSVGKAAMKVMSSLEATAGGVFVGAILFGIGAIAEGFWTLDVLMLTEFWFHVTYLGLAVTFLGFMFYFHGINKHGATRAAVFINLVPVFGTLLSAIFLLEPIYWTFVVGLILVITGVSMINYGPKNTDEEREITEIESEEDNKSAL
jgi:drug/metabolite transporter (DMT)-like permease